MKYAIKSTDDARDNVVEASLSNEPDDVSVASLRIVATHAGESFGTAAGDLAFVTFTLPGTLTTNWRSITPQADDFGQWQMTVEGGGTVRATPIDPHVTGTKTTWAFHLRDIEVATGVGEADIEVAEVYYVDNDDADTRAESPIVPGRPQPVEPALVVRKVHPRLRIDHFRAIIDAQTSTPLAPSTTSDQSVLLSWATTAATKVSVWSPRGEELHLDVSDDPSRLVVPDDPDHLDDNVKKLGPDELDHTAELSVDTTGTYTLVASNHDAHEIAQLTVTVTDVTKVETLDAAAIAATSLTASGAISAESITATDDPSPASATPTGAISANSITATGTISAGAITVTDDPSPASATPTGAISANSITATGTISAGAITGTSLTAGTREEGGALRIGQWIIAAHDDELVIYHEHETDDDRAPGELGVQNGRHAFNHWWSLKSNQTFQPGKPKPFSADESREPQYTSDNYSQYTEDETAGQPWLANWTPDWFEDGFRD